jgi:uncharacterized protein YqeY
MSALSWTTRACWPCWTRWSNSAANPPGSSEQELFEISVIQEFLPQQLSEEEIRALVAQAAQDLGAKTAADMGKLMAAIKPKVQGRADMGLVSQLVKAQLQ